jgi:hypothetical protein
MKRQLQVGIVVAACALVAACASPASDEPTGSPSASEPGSASPTAPATGYGSIYTAQLGGDTKPYQRHVIGPDGSVGEGAPIFTSPASDFDYRAVIDGVGGTLVTGTFSDYWTTQIQVVDAATGEERGEPLDAPQWCGGEGLLYNACALLDGTRMARTSDLGGEGLPESTIYVTSLETGETLAELGPFAGLFNIFGTTDPNTLVILTSAAPNQDPPEPRPGTVARLDVSSGEVTEVGAYPAGWAPICTVGTDSVLGYNLTGDPSATMVGPAAVGQVTWPTEDTPMGCSADGRFLYLQRIPQPPGEEQEDTEAPNPATSLDRIDLSTGVREPVLALKTGEWTEAITR